MAATRTEESNSASFSWDSGNSEATFSSISLGTADANRVIYVVYTWDSGTTISAATINGVTATIVGQVQGSGVANSAIIAAEVPTGTSGDVVFTQSGDPNFAAITVYSSTDASATADDHGGDAGYTNKLSSRTVDLNVAAGSVVIAGSYMRTGGTCTWTGVTEDYLVETSGRENSHASAEVASADATYTVDAQWSTTSQVALYAATFPEASGGTTDALLADNVESASEVSSPAIGQVHALTATDVESSSEVSSPALGQVHALLADNVESASEVSVPALADFAGVDNLLADNVESASELSVPVIGQVHVLLADNVESASEVSTPALVEVVDGVDALLADNVESASEVSSPTLGQVHALTAVSVESASEVSSPTIDRTEEELSGGAPSKPKKGIRTVRLKPEQFKQLKEELGEVIPDEPEEEEDTQPLETPDNSWMDAELERIELEIEQKKGEQKAEKERREKEDDELVVMLMEQAERERQDEILRLEVEAQQLAEIKARRMRKIKLLMLAAMAA